MYKDCAYTIQTIYKRLNLLTKPTPMKKLYFLLIAIIVLIGCNNETMQNQDKPIYTVDVPVTIDEIKVGSIEEVKTVAEFEIEGMTCEIGCAKMIKKTVSDLKGVELTNVNFDSDRNVDYAIVTYNPSIINEYEMAEAVQNLANGQYKVNKIIVKKFLFSKSLEEEEIEKNQTSRVDVKLSFPNILDIFTLVLR